MKIAFLTQQLQGKSETWIWQQIEYLYPYFSFICVQHKVEIDNYKGVKIINLNSFPSFFKRLLNRLRRIKFDYSQNIVNNLAAIDKRKDFDAYYIHFLTQAYQFRDILLNTNKKIFIHCHGYDVTWDLKKMEFPFENFHSTDYIDFVLKIQSKAIFIANSQFTKNNLMSIGIEDFNVKILKFGVKILPKLRVKEYVDFKILFIGRLVDFKGPHLTIKAFEKACEKGMKAKLIICGDGPLMTTCRLMKKISPYGDYIDIIGPISFEEGEKLREECHVFTAHNIKGELTNQVEAYGVAYIEALAQGLPVVTGRSGGIQETIVDGNSGLLFDSGDIEMHARYLLELYNNPDELCRLSKNAYDYAIKNFHKDLEVEAFYRILGL